MLLFIQLLAGFFLRKYSGAMEEFRYYEGLVRQREAQIISYLILRELGDKAAVKRFAEGLSTHINIFKLAKDETTTLIETQKQEINEFKDLAKYFSDIVGELKNLRSGDSGARGRTSQSTQTG